MENDADTMARPGTAAEKPAVELVREPCQRLPPVGGDRGEGAHPAVAGEVERVLEVDDAVADRAAENGDDQNEEGGGDQRGLCRGGGLGGGGGKGLGNDLPLRAFTPAGLSHGG